MLLFGILQERNNPNSLLTAITKIYENNEIKIKLYGILIQLMKINKDFCQDYSYSTTLFNVNANQIITEWKKKEIRRNKISKN